MAPILPKNDPLAELAAVLKTSRSMVAFSGAGLSTESGIPDFRSPGGIWSQVQPVYFDAFLASEAARREYWRQKCTAHATYAAAPPNAGHQVLSRWETAGRLRGVVTQNIDGLHQLAGSRRVVELHGTARVIACLDCQARYEPEPLVEEFLASEAPPVCPACGGLLKHATISFGQTLPTDALETAHAWARECDLFLVLGSSLVVYPAASLPEVALDHGARLAIINRDPTPLDHLADFVLHRPLGATLTRLEELLSESTGNATEC